ncbi:hypothetical protein WHR41_01601 [Cladosporium halotolerans]|uniref:NAD(P)-binding domain-containing protein n=1 Tax=Cladosporium halotolerans TaxID=1052096 RepID=A0AB34KWZ4_9PEZI
MTTTVLAGSTGLVGSHILSTLTASPAITKIHAFARKSLPISEKISPLSSPDSQNWPSLYPTSPTPSLFISALGTTRAQAGSFAAQREIDYDLNLALARRAKEAGTKTYVLVSSGGANSGSMMGGYMKMKGELEDAVRDLDFERTVILRPGLLVGSREDSRPPEAALRKVANFMGAVSGGLLKDFWAQDAEVVARAAVSAALQAPERAEKVWVVGQADVVRLGRTEWKD